jgi:hypothetical protein
LTALAGCGQINGSQPSSAVEKNRNPLRNFNPAGSIRVLIALLPVAGAAVAGPSSATGQVARVTVQENLRASPGGDVIARLEQGTQVATGDREGNWTEVTIEGWVWARSLQARDGGAYDLRVFVDGGENLRREPQGAVTGRLSTGALLEELERRPGWIRVRRTAWMWSPSLQVAEVETPASAAGEGGRGPDETVATATTPAVRVRNAMGPEAILGAPDGDTLATTEPGAGLQVLEREGNWIRVRMEGWVWAPPRGAGSAAAEGPEATQEASTLTPEALAADPDGYVGRVLEWRVQFIAVERAERVRTDFYEGEPYMLTRFGGSSGPFVYIAFPPSRLLEVEALAPLELITVVARVRTGRAGLTGSPILDLIDIRLGGEDLSP